MFRILANLRNIKATPRFYSSAQNSSGPFSPVWRRATLVMGATFGAVLTGAILMKANQRNKLKDSTVIFVLGGPGSGKGTQCANLVKDYGFVHLSAGDLLREERTKNKGSETAELIENYIRNGKIVPMEITISLIKKAMLKCLIDGKHLFLIDGFPRQMDQALKFEEDFVLFFDCPESEMLKRILKRGETSGRSDDNIESIKKRFATFRETSYPVVQYYEKQGRISCLAPIDEVYKTVKMKVEESLKIEK